MFLLHNRNHHRSRNLITTTDYDYDYDYDLDYAMETALKFSLVVSGLNFSPKF